MTNNATWTVIDRGDPDSYFAIWDLIDYMGQGGLLKEQCNLLREVWEEMALSNSRGASVELLSQVMKNYDEKLSMYNFVKELIACMVVKNHGGFDSELVDQFKRVVEKGVEILAGGQEAVSDPIKFVEKAHNALKENGKDENLMFELVADIAPYDAAKETLVNMKNSDWTKYFTYYEDTFATAILEKGKSMSIFIIINLSSRYSKHNFSRNSTLHFIRQTRLSGECV